MIYIPVRFTSGRSGNGFQAVDDTGSYVMFYLDQSGNHIDLPEKCESEVTGPPQLDWQAS